MIYQNWLSLNTNLPDNKRDKVWETTSINKTMDNVMRKIEETDIRKEL